MSKLANVCLEGFSVGLQKEELVPSYVRRSVEGYPILTPLAGLAGGYEAMCQQLPIGSPALLYALDCLAGKAQQLLHGGTVSSKQPGLDLVNLLAHLVLLVDFQVLLSIAINLSRSFKATIAVCMFGENSSQRYAK
jgi:hypothetical protein